MSKKYSQEDIRKGFRNLEKLKKKTVSLEKEVGEEMVKLGFNNDEANAAISMLKRLIPANLA